MQIQRLYADGFRNLQAVELYPHPRFNVLAGHNGQGKTNLLEAIWLLAGLRSFRTRRLSECLHFDRKEAQLGARVARLDGASDIGLRLGGRKNAVFIDGKQRQRARDMLGQLSAVLFTPDDLRLPHGEPAMRRRYLDRAIWSHEPSYLAALRDYEQALSNRNALLREHVGRSIDIGMLEVFDDLVADKGARVATHRERFVEVFSEKVMEQLSAFGADGMTCKLLYSPKHAGKIANIAERADCLREELLARRSTDRRRGHTSVGPHLDDLKMLINQRLARAHASQGQCRALILAMKIAELRSLERVHHEPPILLMDDVSSELDSERNAALMEHLDELGGQVFLTTTDAAHIRVKAPTTVFTVSAGTVKKVDEDAHAAATRPDNREEPDHASL